MMNTRNWWLLCWNLEIAQDFFLGRSDLIFLSIPHYVINYIKYFEENIFSTITVFIWNLIWFSEYTVEGTKIS